MNKITSAAFKNVDITGGFWYDMQKLNREVTIHSVYNRFDDTGRIKAFELGWKEGSELPKPHFFWDSDVAKWMESAADIAQKTEVPELMEKVDRLVDLIEKNQQPDGYFNIYHTIIEPELKFKNRDHHELYCLGHLIEAAVAIKQATGSDRLINVLDKYIDLVIKTFVTDRSADFVTPGHEEIELALMKLYRLTDNKKYLDLAMFFLNERGVSREYYPDWSSEIYYQSHLPVRQQREAHGHSVRACYLYSGMADGARETEDEELLDACRALFDDITTRKMYISGGIGSSHHGEAFTIPYDIPNDTAYNETCAAIALYFFANRMKDIDFDSKYADIAERTMFNGITAGLSKDGKAFFYENPLEINLADYTRNVSVKENDRLPITQRKEVFGCSCCPPNMTRFLASVGECAYGYDENAIYVHQFMQSEADINGAKIIVDTDYPVSGKVHITLKNAKGRKLYVRIPWWCEDSGYKCIDVDEDVFTADFDFDIKPRYYTSSPRVRADIGRVAIMRGPVLYCMEGVDNDFSLFDFKADTKAEITESFDNDLGCIVLNIKGSVSDLSVCNKLYSELAEEKRINVTAKFIPYRLFANRGESDMRVWINKE